MKSCLYLIALLLLLDFSAGAAARAATPTPVPKRFIRQFGPAPPPVEARIEYDDLDGDGDPDVLRATSSGYPVQWVDDDDDMKSGDFQGDADSDCIMVDKDRDGRYGGPQDLIVDWGDEDGDGKADIQVIALNARLSSTGRGPGLYMIVLDTDKDGVFNYVDWSSMSVQCWEHAGQCRFYTDYLGQSAFLKMHASTFAIRDLRLNWENPFLFYDPDRDGLSEYAIRFCDGYAVHPEAYKGFAYPEDGAVPRNQRRIECSGKINLAALSFDLDNDNAPGDEFDFDMSLRFTGPGFDYRDQVHRLKSLRGLPATDKLFYDPRFRQLSELIYPDHSVAWGMVFGRGKWSSIAFVFDEDDDCHRWERVELYDPKDPFEYGIKGKGMDANVQADRSGDRGEWDTDNSGGGKLYIGRFDGKIHLYGAEWGAWRIDQDARCYQGWSTSKDQPTEFATIRYSDTDKNGFIDTIEYDMDGDRTFERKASLSALGIEDRCAVLDTSKIKYEGLAGLYRKMAEAQWGNAAEGVKVAERMGLVTDHYAPYMHPASIREKEHFGFWLSYYIHEDLSYLAGRRGDTRLKDAVERAYYSGNWRSLEGGRK